MKKRLGWLLKQEGKEAELQSYLYLWELTYSVYLMTYFKTNSTFFNRTFKAFLQTELTWECSVATAVKP